MSKDDDELIFGPDRWHPAFYQLLIERGSPGWRVHTEHELGKQARRVDLVLERTGAESHDREARVLRGLWHRLSKATVVEFKSSHEPFLRRHLLRLFDYGVQYHEQNLDTLAGPGELTLVLVVPSLTPSLAWAIEHMDGWRLASLGNGYAQIVGAWYTTFIAFTDQVCEAENDSYLRLFSRHESQDTKALGWMIRNFTRMTTMENQHQMDDFEEAVRMLIESLGPNGTDRFLSMFRPEQRLAGLEPEQRLAGLEPEHLLGRLEPDDLAQALLTLPKEAQALIRETLAGSRID